MAQGISRRRFGTATVLLALSTVLLAAPAQAAPPAAPSTITITGADVPEPLTLRAEDNPELFAAVLSQVSWLNGRGQSSSPAAGGLGPKYTVVVSVEKAARHRYDLYPLAEGGPRAFRPAAQPGKRTTPAWFYGRLTMSETLRAAGVPLPERPDMIHSGVGGGSRVIPERALAPAGHIDRVVGELRRVMLLNAAIVVTITIGLAGISLLVRRRVG
ncbi:hypothetical protein SAMN05444365_11376 [Micromonospora pattaloongensis]|uniref:Uncharacterized protein n=1 Tax=Micromonospora pattaloongensis TaxID=405436 RepID=A0A1H3SR20_9ACTN|nr:hypothetical protein [Micromonospora pattaloongensis]SDZ40456.1 hypothetical protein SAMN05444365_11376 [Micromonospora pattaloongensis]